MLGAMLAARMWSQVAIEVSRVTPPLVGSRDFVYDSAFLARRPLVISVPEHAKGTVSRVSEVNSYPLRTTEVCVIW